MAGEWREVPIGELAEIFDGPHATPPKTSDGPVFLGISNLSNGRITLGTAEHLSEDDHKRWTLRVEPQAGDVVFSYETRLGEAALIPSNLRCCLGRRMGLLRARRGKVDNRFLLYAYLGPPFQETLRSRTIHGSTVNRIPLIDMPRFPIAVPESLDEQRAIAHILGTLDDKIELNRRMSETLEAIARALFKSWFVDFDPVRAKAEGSDPGLPKTLADLFPARLVDSELGEIPEGWEAKPLGDWVDALSGGTPSKAEVRYWRGDVPWISPKVMTAIHADEADAHVDESAIGNGTRLAPALSTLVMVRGMGLHESVRVSQARREVTFNQDVKALVGARIEPTLLLFALLGSQPALLERVESSGHGTGKLPSEVLLALPVTMPDIAAQERLSEQLRTLNDRIASTRAESRTLAALRDTLLPKLISGKLRAPFRHAECEV